MPRIVIYAKDESVEGERFIDKNSFSIGRNRSNDVQILDPSISGSHALVDIEAQSFRITDLGSTNGTEVGSQRIEKAEVLEGQRIRLGGRTVAFFADNKPRSHDDSDYRSTSIIRANLPTEPERLVLIGEPAEAGAEGSPPSQILLTRPRLLIGSGLHCPCRIPSSTIPKEHARITRAQDRLYIQSLDADNPVLINGTPETEAELARGDKIAFGEFLFVLLIGDDSPPPTVLPRETIRTERLPQKPETPVASDPEPTSVLGNVLLLAVCAVLLVLAVLLLLY